jgi:hypothetical protein
MNTRKNWHALHERLRKDERYAFGHPLYYHNGGAFMEIVDRSFGCRLFFINIYACRAASSTLQAADLKPKHLQVEMV